MQLWHYAVQDCNSWEELSWVEQSCVAVELIPSLEGRKHCCSSKVHWRAQYSLQFDSIGELLCRSSPPPPFFSSQLTSRPSPSLSGTAGAFLSVSILRCDCQFFWFDSIQFWFNWGTVRCAGVLLLLSSQLTSRLNQNPPQPPFCQDPFSGVTVKNLLTVSRAQSSVGIRRGREVQV